jgi:hypothetical protein
MMRGLTSEQCSALWAIAATLPEAKRPIFYTRVEARLQLKGSTAFLDEAIKRALDGLVQTAGGPPQPLPR